MTRRRSSLPALLGLLALPLWLAGCPKDAPPKPGATTKPGTTTRPGTTKPAPRPALPKPAPKPAPKASADLLGGERGLDHIGVVVDDLAKARAAYGKLGFSKGQPGRLPNGIKNVNFYFGDSTYLELLTHYDAKKAAGVAGFVDKHRRGAMFFVLVAKSFQRASAFLRQVGVPVGPPIPGRIKSPGFSGKRTMWHTYFFAKPKPLPGDPFFFITYRPSLRRFLLRKLQDPKIRQKSFAQANTAEGTLAVYLVSKSLDKTRAVYRKIQLGQQRDVVSERLGAKGVSVQAGAGYIVLLDANAKVATAKGIVPAFADKRGDGAIIGLTIKVADLAKAKAIVDKGLGKKHVVGDGLFGKSFWVAPKDAFGVWLEFAAGRK